MARIEYKDKICIPKEEYFRLKKLDDYFREFWNYIKHLMEIREARREIKQKKVIPQEKLFKQLGL